MQELLCKGKTFEVMRFNGGAGEGNQLTLWLFGSSGIVESGQKGQGNVADLCNLSGISAQLRLEGISARKGQ